MECGVCSVVCVVCSVECEMCGVCSVECALCCVVLGEVLWPRAHSRRPGDGGAERGHDTGRCQQRRRSIPSGRRPTRVSEAGMARGEKVLY